MGGGEALRVLSSSLSLLIAGSSSSLGYVNGREVSISSSVSSFSICGTDVWRS